MTAPSELDVADALAELVDQFADPLVFLRELVQNALDAGSSEVDVYTELRASPEDPSRGVMVIGVDDYGEGMDRVTIDTKLTRLFSSSKDGDLTKIGKFGIGFVSVFSLRPDAVCVDTSRGGEHWRIVFRADRSFMRIARDQPVDGTKVQVIKAMTRAEHAEIARRAEATLRFWCKHVAGTIRWHDEDIAEPFELPGALCQVRREADGLRVVAGYLPGGETSHGFYNRGLTLLEGRGGGFLAGVSFKVDSRHLEHTLARSDVMRDANFDRVMEVVQELADELDDALVRAVGERLRAGEGPAELDAAYGVLADVVRRAGVSAEVPLARTVEGTVLGAAALRKAANAGTLWIATGESPREGSPVVEAAIAAGHTVLARSDGAYCLDALLEVVVGRSVREATRGLVCPQPARDAAEAERWGLLETAVQALLRALDVTVGGVFLAHLRYPGSVAPERACVLLPAAAARLAPWADDAGRPLERWRRKDALVLNADHRALGSILSLARREPELAAQLLLELVHLEAGALPVAVTSRLATAATELRAQRLERAS